jgi:hypothetical protein
MYMQKIKRCALLWALLTISALANANEVTSIPGGSVIALPSVDYVGAGPQSFTGGTWSSTYGVSVFGWNGGYTFGTNGNWDSALVMAGLNTPNIADTMTFAFTAPVSAVGGFINYNPNGNTLATPTISVYDTSNNLIESAILSFTTGGGLDTGFFYGFSENTANIGSFTFTGNYIGITSLTTSTSTPISTPEPASIALLASGILGFAATRRKKKLLA